MKIKILTITIISCLALSSCDDFLDVAPENSFSVDNFFKNENEVTRSVNAAYVKNRAIHQNLQWRFGENRSDNSSFQYNPDDRGGFLNEQLDEFLMNADNPSIANYWSEAFDGVTRCTFVLENIDDVIFSDFALKNQRKGEVYFLRTWYYFNLVRLYGDIPLPLSTVSNVDGALTSEFTQRVDREVIYDTLFSNIDSAIEFLPDEWDSENTGRATRGAALMLKAKMHMARQEYPEAVSALEELQTIGYSLVANYVDVFDPNNKNHSESIFDIQYDFNLGQGSNFVTSFIPYNSGGDLLAFGQLAQSRAGQNQPTQSLIDLYEDGDDRLEHNIGYYVDENDSIPWMKKYAFEFLDLGITNVNWPMFRYADALLMLAESRVRSSQAVDQTAIGTINIIRLRSGVGPVNPSSVEDLLQIIADERRRELAFENHRWFDLVRTGQAEAVMMAHGDVQKTEKGILGEGGIIAPEAYTNIRTTLAIPTNQRLQFGYTQNEEWE
ncbi:RagB/SusD family nutrient uptake outer membrane protein [Ekhidna sp.]